MQKVMVCITKHSGIRSEIIEWNFENGNCVSNAFCEKIGSENAYKNQEEIPVELISYTEYGRKQFPSYPTILHALGDHWKLLAPPQRYAKQVGSELTSEWQISYEWWLVRDQESF